MVLSFKEFYIYTNEFQVKCETCLSAEAIQPQIFVVATAPDTSTVKFEESTGTQTTANLGTQNSIPIGVKNNHPVKRRGVASVTKCTKCNGSGIIFIGGAKNQQNNVDKPFHCNICNGSFSRYSSLWSHKRLHTGEKNFKCNICGLAFAKAAYLKNHSRIHTGEKPYRCNVCGMQFSQSPHLKNHERIHSGERPYVCEVFYNFAPISTILIQFLFAHRFVINPSPGIQHYGIIGVSTQARNHIVVIYAARASTKPPILKTTRKCIPAKNHSNATSAR